MRGRISITDRVTRSVNHLLDGIIMFQAKTAFLQDLHIVGHMILMFTNRWSGIKVSDNKTR